MNKNFLLISIFLIILSSCTSKSEAARSFQSFSRTDISEIIQTDSEGNMKVVPRPIFDDKILGIWTLDPNGQHADVVINDSTFYLVDTENPAFKYSIDENIIEVHYSGADQIGLVELATEDTLIIDWNLNEEKTIYTRWKH